jgi:hypothetical protein
MNRLGVILIFIGGGFATFAVSLAATLNFSAVSQMHLPREVQLRSEESFAADGGPVFNRIRFFEDATRDIWMMNQSHEGLTLATEKWDRLAIVVDRKLKTAQFFQLESGALDWSEGLKQRQFRVSCALCHSNGPRAIRPAPADARTFGDWLRVSLWNIKIKRYPRLRQEAGEGFNHSDVPLRFAGSFANSPLKVAVCACCHREDGLVARGTLTRQNALTISAMVANGHMPPLGIPLPDSQLAELNRFLKGF